MSIYQLIFTHKNISKANWYNDIHTLQNVRKILWQFFIIMELELYLYYFMMTKTPYLPSVKTNEHISTNIHPLKYIKVSMGNGIHTLQNGRKILW